MRRRWDLILAAAALATAIFDLWSFTYFGLELDALTGSGAGWLVLGGFVLGYTALGFVVGRLVMARAREKAAKARIQAQLEELERTRAQVVEHEKLAAIGRLAAGIAHEVRNPLGVIRASASMMRECFEPEDDNHRACEFITEEIDRLDGLIGGLLSFARPHRLALETRALPPILERAKALAEEATESVSVDVATDEALPSLRLDHDLMTQLVLGLVLNAAESGATRVKVQAGKSERGAAIEVRDDGPGVAEEHRAHVFEPFYTTKAAGTGLGLPMAARIAQAHGGVLTLGEDAGLDGRGACFRLELPLEGPRFVAEAA